MIKVFVLTPQKEVFSSEVKEIVIPTDTGEIGVLTDHAELFTSITSGILKLKNKEKTEFFAIHHGFVHICNNKIAILVKLCENPQEIDKIRLEKAQQKIQENLQQKDTKWSNKFLRYLSRKELLEIS